MKIFITSGQMYLVLLDRCICMLTELFKNMPASQVPTRIYLYKSNYFFIIYLCNSLQHMIKKIMILLSCQQRVTVMSCFVYKVIRDL